MYKPVPPEAPDVEMLVVWLLSTGFWVADRVPADRAEPTVNERGLLSTALPFESVTATVTEKGDPVVVLGEQVIVAELDAVHPAGRPVQA